MSLSSALLQACPRRKQTSLELPTYLGVGDRGERHFTDSFICPINHFNGFSAITIIPRAGRAGVPTISRIEKPWMAVIINAHNKNMPGSCTPRAPLHPPAHGPAAPAPGQPRGAAAHQGAPKKGCPKPPAFNGPVLLCRERLHLKAGARSIKQRV